MVSDATPIIGLVLHFRTPERTLACLRSLRNEGMHWAVLVDNSEDGGKSIATMVHDIDDLRTYGLEVTVLHQDKNKGFARGVAAGLTYVSSQRVGHVLLINSDAVLGPGSLSRMDDALRGAGIVVPKISQSGHSQASSFASYDRFFGLITRTPVMLPVIHPSGCCLLIHRDHAKPTLFDSEFFFYGEDVMLGFDAALHGVVVVECPEAVVLHARSVSAKNGSMFYEYHMNRAHWLLAHKLARNRAERFIFVAARCVTLPMRASLRGVRFHSLMAWKGLIAATCDVLRGRCRSFTPPT